MKPKIITRIITQGDSLTDRGTANRRLILRYLSDLHNKSPRGRFTNGYTWSDHISARFISDFLISHFKRLGLRATEISDAILTGDAKVENLIQQSYSLDNDLYVKYKGHEFVRTYDEGGLTSHDYSWSLSYNPSRFFTRLILSTLESKREKLLAYDREQHISAVHKEQTLIVEWSGANDLITVNARPSHLEADRAINARIKNAETLIKNGYRHFVLFNLPDLSLSPRYQVLGGFELDNAHECSAYFNEQLAKAANELAEMYPHCSITVFDTAKHFKEIYDNPEKYHFEKKKRDVPYTTSPYFKIRRDGTSPADGFMFWDDIHPSADIHALLAEFFYEKFAPKYHFSAPDLEILDNQELDISVEKLQNAFIKKYSSLLSDKALNMQQDLHFKEATLEEIFRKGLQEETLTRHVMTELQWIDKRGRLNLNIPALKIAMEQAMMSEGEKEVAFFN